VRNEMLPISLRSKWVEKEEHKASKIIHYDYRNIMTYKRVFVKGFAGSGKSYMIKKLQENLKNFAYIAFTNTAANNINGITAHNLFNMGIDGITDEKTMSQIINKYDGIVIDEINQFPAFLYRILSKLPPNFKIYGFGDFRQEEPIEEKRLNGFNYYDSQVFILLFNGNLIQLEKQCRSDTSYADACIKFHDTEDFNVIKPFLSGSSSLENKNELNITRTNITRKFINNHFMKLIGSKIKDKRKIKKNSPQGQDMYLYEGLPVIANKTSKEYKFFNNEMFVVVDCCVKNEDIKEEKHIVRLKTRSLNKNTIIKVIDIPIFVYQRSFYPGYACTTYSIEGATIDIPHTIHEFNDMKIKSKYTALTRTVNSNLITINFEGPNISKANPEQYNPTLFKKTK
jgi:hypothetical protein